MKHVDDSHIRISVIYNCRYIFVLFNEKHVHEFKKLKVLVFAGILVFALQGDGLDTNSSSLMALKLLVAEICQGKGPSVCALLLFFL